MSEAIRLDGAIETRNSISYEHALPELRWALCSLGARAPEKVLQQRWRIVTNDSKPPRHEWRDVPTVKEGS